MVESQAFKTANPQPWLQRGIPAPNHSWCEGQHEQKVLPHLGVMEGITGMWGESLKNFPIAGWEDRHSGITSNRDSYSHNHSLSHSKIVLKNFLPWYHVLCCTKEAKGGKETPIHAFASACHCSTRVSKSLRSFR